MRTTLFASLVLALALAAGPPAHALDPTHDCITSVLDAPDGIAAEATALGQELTPAAPAAVAVLDASAPHALPPHREVRGVACSTVGEPTVPLSIAEAPRVVDLRGPVGRADRLHRHQPLRRLASSEVWKGNVSSRG